MSILSSPTAEEDQCEPKIGSFNSCSHKLAFQHELTDPNASYLEQEETDMVIDVKKNEDKSKQIIRCPNCKKAEIQVYQLSNGQSIAMCNNHKVKLTQAVTNYRNVLIH